MALPAPDESDTPSVTWLSKRNREDGWSADSTQPDPAEKEEKDVTDRDRQDEPGELIVDESSYDGWIYYLIAGRVRIVKAGNELAVLQRTGDVFGEVGSMGSGELSVSVYALDEATCLKIDISTVDGLPNENRYVFRYVIFRGFAEVLAKRLRITTEKFLAAKDELDKLKAR